MKISYDETDPKSIEKYGQVLVGKTFQYLLDKTDSGWGELEDAPLNMYRDLETPERKLSGYSVSCAFCTACVENMRTGDFA